MESSLNQDEYLENLLGVDDIFEKKYYRISTVKLLLLGAREFSGRNIKSGIYEYKDLNDYDFLNELYLAKRFNGILLYLILLEQLGNLFQSNTEEFIENGLERALFLFSKKLTGNKIDALKNLRNSLAHRFSLCTEKKGSNMFKYNLNWDTNDEEQIIILPIKSWNGDYKESDESIFTTIYVQSLTDEIEKIYNRALLELREKKVKLAISIDEINSRFTIIC